MDIGTDKIMLEQRKGISHHMLDIVDPGQTYTAGQWKQDVQTHISHIHTRENTPIIVGGTGLYIDTLYKNFAMPNVAPDPIRRTAMMEKETSTPGYLHEELTRVDPQEAMKHHQNSTRYILRALEIHEKTGKTKTSLAQQRPVQRPLFMLGLRRNKEDTNKRINARIKDMFAT